MKLTAGKLFPPSVFRTVRKAWMVMRITTLILFTAALHVAAKTSAQKISLSQDNMTVDQFFNQLKKQTGYSFLLKDGTFSPDQKLTVHVANASLQEVLDKTLTPLSLTYQIENKIVYILKAKPETPDLSLSPPPIDIHGRIVNEDGDPVVGASVKIKGTNIGTSTDVNGDFVLKNVDAAATLVFTGTNIETFERSIKGKTDLGVVTAKTKIASIQEVVVNKGYYTTSQALNTGSTFKVTGKEIQQQPVSDPIAALEGRVPGLYISQTSGMPGSNFTVRLRGQNSIPDIDTKLGTVNDPLYIVDGVPLSSQSLTSDRYGGGVVGTPGNGVSSAGLSPFNNLDPSNIESIEVLKDADATAIYGSRGANGVILITTKKGKSGTTKLDANISNGWGKVAHRLHLLNTQQYLEMRNEAFSNDGILPSSFDYDVNGSWDSTRYTDWQEVLIGKASHFTNAQLNISGGNNATQFLIGGSYNNQGTVFPGNYHDIKASAHLNLTHQSMNGHFRVEAGADYMNDNNQLPLTDPTKSITLAPDAPALYDPFGNLNWQLINNGTTQTFYNPLSYFVQQAVAITKSLNSHLQIGFTPLDGLELRLNFGYQNTRMEQNLITPFSGSYAPTPGNIAGAADIRSNTLANSSIITWIIEPQVLYHKAFGKSNLDALIGNTTQQSISNAISFFSNGYNSDALIYSPTAASVINFGNYENTLYKYNAVYARLGYNWDEKYVFNLTGRRDGSSRFGPGKRFGNFWAIGGAWIFSKERWVENALPFLSFGKLRASYGTTGNDRIKDYAYLSTYQPISMTYQGFVRLDPTQLTNPFFAWEEVRKAEVGIELGLLKSRVNLMIDYYRNRTINQLTNEPLPTITGFSGVLVNLPATIQNSGVELTLHTINIKLNDFSWGSSFNTTFPRNKLVAFPDLATTSYANSYIVGKSLFLVRMYQYGGVNPMTGLYSFKTKSGNPSNPTPQDRVVKEATQNLYGGIGNTFIYRSFSLDLFIELVRQTGKSYLQSFNAPGSFNIFSGQNNQPVDVLDRWQHPGDVTTIQRFSTTTPASTQQNFYKSSDLLFEDNEASFIRLKNLAFSYQLPKRWQKPAHLQSARLYIQCQNLFTITKFKGLDPETGGSLVLPPLRVITFGAQLTL